MKGFLGLFKLQIVAKFVQKPLTAGYPVPVVSFYLSHTADLKSSYNAVSLIPRGIGAMTRDNTLNHINDIFGDIGGVIGNPLEIPGYR